MRAVPAPGDRAVLAVEERSHQLLVRIVRRQHTHVHGEATARDNPSVPYKIDARVHESGITPPLVCRYPPPTLIGTGQWLVQPQRRIRPSLPHEAYEPWRRYRSCSCDAGLPTISGTKTLTWAVTAIPHSQPQPRHGIPIHAIPIVRSTAHVRRHRQCRIGLHANEGRIGWRA